MHNIVTKLLRQLDLLPIWLALPLGILAAAGPGFLLADRAGVAGAIGVVLLLGLAGALAISGQPVEDLRRIRSPEAGKVPGLAPPRVQLVDMVRIQAGSFQMGSPDDEEGRYGDEGPAHTVHVSAFECARYPITRKLYEEITGEDPGWPEGEADKRPINKVSWFDAVTFCNMLSDKAGLQRCYEINDRAVAWNKSADGYRLLTEAEWEYAARAGTTTRWSFGDDEKDLGGYGWYDENSDYTTHPVGELDPNPWGLFDMHGNVYEWCWDWFGQYESEEQLDPAGPDDGDLRVLRGGAFVDSARDLRSAYRFGFRPEVSIRVIGFRCARGPRRQH